VDGLTDGEADTDSPGLPLGAEVSLGAGPRLGIGDGVGSGNRALGTFSAASTNMDAKPRITINTHTRARRSPRGGSDPRYPGCSALIGREA
jgi:hypothetical protein